MWITNGGFADVYIVFAKVDGENKNSAFVVPRSENSAVGAAKSTNSALNRLRQRLLWSDAKIPVGEPNRQRRRRCKIAFNVRRGPFQTGASVTAVQSSLFTQAVRYANERHQFNIPISSFGAIKHKLAEMANPTWVADRSPSHGRHDRPFNRRRQLTATMKLRIDLGVRRRIVDEAGRVFLSLDYVVDERSRLYGGYGYSADYPAEQAYRDSRDQPNFEYQRRLNRMLIPAKLMSVP